MDGVITKPVNQAALLATIADVVSRHRRPAAEPLPDVRHVLRE
jgi:hypothetical protein